MWGREGLEGLARAPEGLSPDLGLSRGFSLDVSGLWGAQELPRFRAGVLSGIGNGVPFPPRLPWGSVPVPSVSSPCPLHLSSALPAQDSRTTPHNYRHGDSDVTSAARSHKFRLAAFAPFPSAAPPRWRGSVSAVSAVPRSLRALPPYVTCTDPGRRRGGVPVAEGRRPRLGGLGGSCEALQPDGGWGDVFVSSGVFGGSGAARRRSVPQGVCWGALVPGVSGSLRRAWVHLGEGCPGGVRWPRCILWGLQGRIFGGGGMVRSPG